MFRLQARREKSAFSSAANREERKTIPTSAEILPYCDEAMAEGLSRHRTWRGQEMVRPY